MSRHIGMMGVAALVCSIVLQAQTPPSRETSRAVPGTITVTGCVERADQVSGSVTAGTTVDSLSFVLIKATKSTGADSRTVGTGGLPKGTETGSMYRLDADVSTLNPHVGHKVEVTGTLVSAPKAASAEPSSAANAPKMKVDRVKMLSETCGR